MYVKNHNFEEKEFMKKYPTEKLYNIIRWDSKWIAKNIIVTNSLVKDSRWWIVVIEVSKWNVKEYMINCK